MATSEKITPMMKQYLEVKANHEDCILMFRLGDFYEMFNDDAYEASEILNITLTGKGSGPDRIPMCGVPFHSVDGYIAKLIAAGKKVAICEQMEDPKETKTIVRRDVVRIITPGTVNLDGVLNERQNNYLASVYYCEDGFGVVFIDATTGDVFATYGDNDIVENRLANAIACFAPAELIVNDGVASHIGVFTEMKKRFSYFDSMLPEEDFDLNFARELIDENSIGLGALTYEKHPLCIRALGGALAYLKETQKINLSYLNEVRLYFKNEYKEIDLSSRRNLELTSTMRDKSKKGSLLGVLDKTRTSMGARLLAEWVDRPLMDSDKINMRLDSVDELYSGFKLREDLQEALRGFADMERISSKIVYGNGNARDLLALANSLKRTPEIKNLLKNATSPLLSNVGANLDTVEDVCSTLCAAIADEPPFSVREGGMIRKGYDAQLDSLRQMKNSGTGILSSIEEAERERTGIKQLKISYNKVFGYYIEVSKTNTDKVPADYIRKQTLVNCERYITEELKRVEDSVTSAKDKIEALEYDIFITLKNMVVANLKRIQNCAKMIAAVDVLCSLAFVAAENGYVKPVVDDGDVIDIKDGRHPSVEISNTSSLFVPNDTYLNTGDNRFLLITGPNMAGKSTYMRQTALITLMAQMGSFVPASVCRIGVVDRVFTRVGASDDIAAGQSTFMVEMSEVANILKNATSKSLIILDEIGRGTSTFDGLSIAWAVVEYVSNKEKIGAKTMFATHYHELKVLEDKLDGVKNFSIAVKKRGKDIIFLRKIIAGGASDSYGIEVAGLAGVPDEVTERAQQVLSSLEGGQIKANSPQTERVSDKAEQMQFPNELAERIKNIDVSTLTPIEAINELYTLQLKLREE